MSCCSTQDHQFSIYNLITVAGIIRTSKCKKTLTLILRWLFGFLCILVKKLWFTEIILLFLPVGHTHEKVDRDLFAPLGNVKKTLKCETKDDFPNFTRHAFRHCRNKPKLESNVHVWDWKKWLDPHLRKIENFKDYRAFRFSLNAQSDPVIMFKKSILKNTWLGFENSTQEGECFFFQS